MKTKRDVLTMFALLVCMAVAAVLVDHSPSDQELDGREYCQQVHAGKWPDFHRVYKQQCNPDGTLNMAYVQGR
jgi:hypothetical protein